MAKKTADKKKAILELGKDSDFWQVICEFIDESIERIEEEKTDMLEALKDTPADQFKVKMLNLEYGKKILQDLKTYPDNLIGYLSDKKPLIENYDPYYKSR